MEMEEKVEEVEKVEKNDSDIKKKKNKKKIIIIVCIILVLFGVCLFLVLTKKDTKSSNTKTEAKKVYSEYRMSGNQLEDFDLKFLQLENNNKNTIYSPLSIKYALAMLSEGAKGKTKEQIDALIGDYKSKKYENSSNMSFANAMFIRNTYKNAIKENYKNNLQQKYYADIIYDDFANPNNVNSWVSNKTFNLINDLVDDVSQTQFILINALAIDMEWNKKIQATTETYSDMYSVKYNHENYNAYIPVIEDDNYGSVKFNNSSKAKSSEIGASINNYDIIKELGENNIRETISKEYQEWLTKGENCGTENLETSAFVDKFVNELKENYGRVDASTDFQLYVDDDVKVFEKELKEYNGTTLEYIGIMPKNKDLNQFIKETNAKSINETINKLKPVAKESFEEGKVTKIIGGIPLFKYDYELELVKDLKTMGVTDIFDSSKIDISNITDDKSISLDASHKANIEFSNDGIKAAAATQAGGMGAAGCGFEHLYEVPVVTIDLTFDNPYMYIIRDKNTKEVWFVGTVYNPIENTNQYSKVINE